MSGRPAPCFVVLALALTLAGCAAAPSFDVLSDTVPVPTMPSSPPGTPAACMAALIEGTLVADDRWGIALRGTDGGVIKVVWPHGYVARRTEDGMVLLDAAGIVVGRAGQHVSLGGGMPDGTTWVACSGIEPPPG